MRVRIGTGISTHGDARIGAIEAAHAAGRALDGARADLAVVFAAGAHLAAPEATLEGVHEALRPPALVGCGAAGVLGCGAEHEGGTAVAVWAAALGDGDATTFHATAEQVDETVAISGIEPLAGASGAILLPDPLTFPTEALLAELAAHAPGVPIVGGLASARTAAGGTALFHGDAVVEGGAVGVRLDGVDLLPCVSQGAAPVGPELTVTAAEGNVIAELGGRPALDRIREAVAELDARERTLVAGGLLIGLAVEGALPDGAPPGYGPGDFLVRGLLGADPVAGTLTVAAPVRAGQVVRLHARDAAAADADLHDQLRLRVEALGGAAAGALAFACHSRGREMFGIADHDAGLLVDALDGAPSAGFFAAGEIGPVGGASFIHTFTATVALFG